MSRAAYLNAERWTEAACVTWDDPDLWFPDGINVDTASLAIAICNSCPVKDLCAATYWQEEHGIVAGTTPRQRTAATNQANR